MKTTQKVAAAVLSGAIAIGGATATFAASGGDGSGKGDVVTVLCANQDTIVADMTQRQSLLQDRIEVLQQVADTATANGHTKLASRTTQRIAKLQARLDKVTARIAAAPAWIAEHCS